MHTILVALAVLFLAGAFFSALVVLREHYPRRRFVWSIAGAALFVTGASFLFWHLLTCSPRVDTLLAAAVVLVVLGSLFWIILLTDNGRTRGSRSPKFRIAFAAKVAGSDWQSLDTSTLVAEDRRQASRIGRIVNVGAGLVVVPGIALVLAASILMNLRGNQASDFVAHAVGLYSLLIATCWTASYVITILLVSLTQILRGNGSGLTLSQVAISLGTWAGLGAAGGVFVGALVPLVVVPLAQGDLHLLGVSMLDSISPTLLLDISTAGAVFGFLLGEVISATSISQGEQNLYVKVCAPPLVFAGVASALGLIGLSPGKLSRALGNEYQKTVLDGLSQPNTDPFQTALSAGLDSKEGWASVVAGLEQHGWNQVVDQDVYYLLTWLVAALVVAFGFTIQVRKRERELLQHS